jgi:hypothetical protein
MLDLSHPLTDAVFFASGIEDEIRVYLLTWKKALETRQDIHCHAAVIESLIPKLHALNTARFEKSAGITATLDALQKAIESNDYAISWNAFLDLAERPNKNRNFGTWAI